VTLPDKVGKSLSLKQRGKKFSGGKVRGIKRAKKVGGAFRMS